MASGITHILLMKHLQDRLPDGPFKLDLAAGRDFLQVGAVGPDLPYASIADDDWFFSTKSEMADKFHYEHTNEICLNAFTRMKREEDDLSDNMKLYLFCLFLGFASHNMADGIVHPFIRDMVGEYNEHQTEHRVLEMDIDVLLFHLLMKNTNADTNFNDSDLHEELKNIYEDGYPETPQVFTFFCDMIREVYGDQFNSDEILGWVKGLYRMFDLAEGNHHPLYRGIGFIKSFLFSNLDQLRARHDEILILTKPVDRDENFVYRDRVHFFDDIIPRFYDVFIPFTEKAYNYIFNNGEELTELDIAPINLDNGRPLVQSNNLDVIPTYWS
jgi:hypothetical protein